MQHFQRKEEKIAEVQRWLEEHKISLKSKLEFTWKFNMPKYEY